MSIKANTLQTRSDRDSKWPKILIAILSTIGVVDTGSITLKNWGILNSLSCPGMNSGCEKVLNSPWGTLFKHNQINIPLSFAGFISYTGILIFVLILTLKIISPKHKLNQILWWFIYLISCASSAFSLLLINIMFFKIEEYCFFCILSAILSFSIFILSIIGAKFDSREPMIYRGIIITFTILIGGLIWSNQVDPAKAEISSVKNEKIAPPITTESSKDKIAFAKYLTKNNIVMYSAYWCPHCHDQKQLFGKEAADELVIIECAKDGINNQYKLCREKEIEGFPSWEINQNIFSGTKDLKDLAVMSDYKGDTNF